jgi:lipoprotein signal peptidase
MLRATLALAGTTAVVAAIDLVHKAGTQAAYFHARSAIYVVVVLGLAAVWTGAILATGSLSMAVGGGVLAGGALGNLLSLALWPGVPNPIELDPIAFNLADVFVLSGFLFTVAAALVFALRNRERLGEPVRLAR